MYLRTIVFLGIYLGLMAVAPFFPAAGVWGFVFESNYHPPYNRWWGEPLLSLGERWSYYIGAVMVASTLLHWPFQRQAPVFRHPETIFLALFTLNTFVVTSWAFVYSLSLKGAIDTAKWFLVYLCLVKTHSGRRWMSVVLLIYIVAAIDAGLECTFNPKRGRFVRGGPTTACFDENFVSAQMVSLLPLMGLYAVSPGVPKSIRLVCAGGVPFVLNVIAHGQSRGAFVALVAAAVAVPVFTKGPLRRWSILAVVVGALLAMRLFHDQFWERMWSIGTHHQDRSSTNRIDAWRDAWSLSIQDPLGYGAEAFDKGLPKSVTVSTHNMYLECLVAWGFQGALLWLAFLGVTLRSAYIISLTTLRRTDVDGRRLHIEAVGILCGMIGMLVASIFINRMRWEMWQMFAAYVVCLKNTVASSSRVT
uniref:O-antigen ligase-related domain-containing protein n=1 Tax=Schlesneria paludicola TaxID=360056 RepID=A0A7C4QMC5_9PLAN